MQIFSSALCSAHSRRLVITSLWLSLVVGNVANAAENTAASAALLRLFSDAHLHLEFGPAEAARYSVAGQARTGVALSEADERGVARDGSDGFALALDGGWVDLSAGGPPIPFHQGEFQGYTIAVRYRPAGTPDGTLFSLKAPAGGSVPSFDLSHSVFEPWEHRMLSFTCERVRGDGFVSVAPGAWVSVVAANLNSAPASRWHTIIVRGDAAALEMLLDGVQQDRRSSQTRLAGVRSYAPLFHHAAPVGRLGADPFGRRAFKGMIDYVAVWKRRLDDEEVGLLSAHAAAPAVAATAPVQVAKPALVPGVLREHVTDEARMAAIEQKIPAMLARLREGDPHFPRFHPAVPGFIYNTHAIYSAGGWHLFPMWVGDVNFRGWLGTNKFTLAHFFSEDLVNWRVLPFPIRAVPDGAQVCNASFFFEQPGQPSALLLANLPGAGGAPALMRADDAAMRTWRPAPGAPMIRAEGPGFHGRLDPAVFRRNGRWYLTAGRNNRELGRAAFPLYRSDDLLTWDYVGVLHDPELDHFIYECAQMLEIAPGRWLLTAGSEITRRGDHYVIGRFEGETFRIEAGGRWDEGSEPRFIAHSAADPRGRIMTWFTLPLHSEQDALSDARAGWKGMQTLPREAYVRAGGALGFRPPAELEKLRQRAETGPRTFPASSGENWVPFTQTRGGELECELVFERTPGVPTGIALLDDSGPFARIFLDPAGRCVVVDLAGGPPKGTTVGKKFRTPPLSGEGTTPAVRVYFDRSVLEVFADGHVISVPVFPRNPASVRPAIWAAGLGDTAIDSARAWTLRDTPVVFDPVRANRSNPNSAP